MIKTLENDTINCNKVYKKIAAPRDMGSPDIERKQWVCIIKN